VILEAGTTKNKDARKFPFTDELREVLQQQWEDREDSWVFLLKGRRSVTSVNPGTKLAKRWV